MASEHGSERCPECKSDNPAVRRHSDWGALNISGPCGNPWHARPPEPVSGEETCWLVRQRHLDGTDGPWRVEVNAEFAERVRRDGVRDPQVVEVVPASRLSLAETEAAQWKGSFDGMVSVERELKARAESLATEIAHVREFLEGVDGRTPGDDQAIDLVLRKLSALTPKDSE